jgi:AcrR family transcriptional regulator
MSASQIIPFGKRTSGRPRTLTLDAILDAACEIGLDQIEMALVAARLGTGVATLYGYVDNKNHLVRLAAERLRCRDRIEDRGQSWQDVLRDYAGMLFALLCEWPRLVQNMMDGEVGDVSDIENADAVLKLLIDRGVPAKKSLALYYAVNQLVIGAVVGNRYRKALIKAAGGEAALGRDLRARAKTRNLQALRQGLSGKLPDVLGDYRPALEMLIGNENA